MKALFFWSPPPPPPPPPPPAAPQLPILLATLLCFAVASWRMLRRRASARSAAPSASATKRISLRCSEEEARACAALELALASRGVRPATAPHETVQATLVRFLRACKGDAAAAEEMVAADIAWREEHAIGKLLQRSANEVLDCDEAIVQAVAPCVCVGVDRAGRPLILKHMGSQCQISRLLKHTSQERLLLYGARLNEGFVAALADAGASEWTIVIDAAGWHLGARGVTTCPSRALSSLHLLLRAEVHAASRCSLDVPLLLAGLFDSAAVTFLRNTAVADGAHHPERLAAMIVLNAPRVLAVAWGVIRTWIDAVTADKIHILAEADKEGARDVLLRYAAPSQLPPQYGGTGGALPPTWPVRGGVLESTSD